MLPSIAAVVAAAALLVTPASAAPPGAALSSDVTRTIDDGYRDAYNALPPEVQRVAPRPLPERAAPAPAPAAPAAPAGCANCVAITYDDGPVADTNRLLDTLAQKNARATFFVTGANARQNPQTLRRMRDAGHTIGNHTDTHPQLPLLNDAALARELDTTSRSIHDATGQTPRWLRPPYGATNERVAGAAKQRGLALALWDVDTLDWQHRNTQTTCRVAVDNARAGSVILMHDIHRSTVDAAPCVIDGLRAKGLRPVALEEMIPQPAPGRTYTVKP